MNKLFLVLFISLIIIFLFSKTVLGAGLVPCGNPGEDACTIAHFFVMLANIYDFIVKYIATTLAVIMITVGAIFMMISAGNQNLFGTGRKMVYSAIIGLILVFGSWLIIDTILNILGYSGNWFSLP